MAWWAHLILFKGFYKHYKAPEGGQSLDVIYKIAGEYVKNNLIELLYILLSIFTYLYLVLSILAFFLPRAIPAFITSIVEILAEPYLGALGVYIIVREIEHSRRRIVFHKKEYLVSTWLLFSLVATAAISFSEYYEANELYKTILTNTLATIIIRIGILVR